LAVLKKLIVASALLFALAAATVGVLNAHKRPVAAPKEPCVVGLSCPSVDSLPVAW